MSATYTVEQVVGEPREWEGKYGKNISYKLQLKDVDGPVELSQKPETPAPKVGDSLAGDIEPARDPRFPARFKKEQRQGGGGNWSGGGMSPEREKRIASLANWKVAPDIVRLANELGITVKEAYDRCKVVKEALDKDAA